MLPVLGGSRVFGGRCLFAEALSEALGSAWLIPVEDGALDTYCRSETLLPRCYSFLVDCIKVGKCVLHKLDEEIPEDFDPVGKEVNGTVDAERRFQL